MTPRTVLIPGAGTNSLTFTIPPSVEFSVESVVATVDASGAAATTGELKVADQSGVVIATKRQGLSIPAGGSGTETWALRLDDERAAAAATGGYPFCQAGIGGAYAVPSGVATAFGIDPGSLLTSDSSIFGTDVTGGGVTGVKIKTAGTYAAWWGVEYLDDAGFPLANPQNFVCEAADSSGSIIVGLPDIGSFYARGFTNLFGQSTFDISWLALFCMHASAPPNDPIILSGNQATGVTLNAYTQVMMFQLSPVAIF